MFVIATKNTDFQFLKQLRAKLALRERKIPAEVHIRVLFHMTEVRFIFLIRNLIG